MRVRTIAVRSARADDAAPFAAADAALFGVDAWSEGSFAEEIFGPGRVYLVAEVGGEMAGYAGLWFDGDDAQIMTIGTLTPWQRQGVAAALLRCLEAKAHGLGARRLLLEVSVTNEPAIAFYRKHGFAELGRRRRYYRDGSDAFTMAKDVGEATSSCGTDAKVTSTSSDFTSTGGER